MIVNSNFILLIKHYFIIKELISKQFVNIKKKKKMVILLALYIYELFTLYLKKSFTAILLFYEHLILKTILITNVTQNRQSSCVNS